MSELNKKTVQVYSRKECGLAIAWDFHLISRLPSEDKPADLN